MTARRTVLVALCLFAFGCSDNDSSNPGNDAAVNDGGMDGDVRADGGPDAYVPQGCDTLAHGMNANFMVDGQPRSFILGLPNNVATGGPWPVVFCWHGMGDTAGNFANLVNPLVNTPDFSFIAVIPEDTDYTMFSLPVDWDMFDVPDGAVNIEARLFDEVLACLDARWGVDPDHVHTMGFSLGGGVSDLIGVVRGERIASIATYSGAYLSNQANVATLGQLSSMVSWPDPVHGNAYTQIFLHGGTTDTYNAMVVTLHFDTFAVNDVAYLNGMGHDAVLCDHGGGHTAPPADMGPARLIEFFRDHPRGTIDSPYGTNGLPANFPNYCSFSPGN